MKTFNLIITCMLFFVSCKNKEKSIIDTDVIDIEYGLQNLTQLKTSDFGKTVRYIPLETTNDGLVGNNPIIKVLGDFIVMEFQNSCLLFDKNDGKFISEIGRFGQGPDEFTSNFSWADEKEEFLYFQRRPNQLLKYDMKGKFSGNVKFATSNLASYYLITDSVIIGYFGDQINSTNPFALGFFDVNGNLNDTVSQLFPKKPIEFDMIANISVLKNHNMYGNWTKTGIILINFKDETRQITTPNPARVWNYKGNIRFKEDFVDTLYTVSDKNLIPSIVFNTGIYHWPAEESRSIKNAKDRIYISDVSENEKSVFFQCIKGLFADESILYNGLYNKQTGSTKLSKYSDEIEDDLTQFMPFTPFGISTAGEFVSYVEAYKAIEWLEKHPEAKNNDKLSFLKNLDEEMNPVIILVE